MNSEDSENISRPEEKRSVSFKDLRVTTMVVIVSFSSVVNIDLLFPLLSMKDFELEQKYFTKKITLPVLEPGSLLSARYKGVVRGKVKFQSPKFFKNAITIDISNKDKNVSAKVSKSKFQMCGIKSARMAEETACLLFEHIEEVARFLPTITDEHLDAAEKYVHTNDEQCLEGLDKNIMTRLVRYALECTEIEQYDKFISDIRNCPQRQVRVGPLEITEVHRAMANYNFPLGFKILRYELARNIDGVEEFSCYYDNTTHHNVVIEHPHNVTRNRKKKSPHVTLTVYQSGLVTLSGPNEEVIMPIYEKFVRIVRQIRHLIEKPH